MNRRFSKTCDEHDRLTGAEKLDAPVYVRWQDSNGLLVRCDDETAQGIVGADNETVYLINGHMPHGEREPYAEIITEEEYRQIVDEDPEDETPDIPEGTDEQDVLTRAELTERLNFLEECLLEMSERVYADN